MYLLDLWALADDAEIIFGIYPRTTYYNVASIKLIYSCMNITAIIHHLSCTHDFDYVKAAYSQICHCSFVD